VLQLHWVELGSGEIVSVQLKRAKFLEHFANRLACLIGMEDCGGSQHRARDLDGGAAAGHQGGRGQERGTAGGEVLPQGRAGIRRDVPGALEHRTHDSN
jgi:hypothetical protein